MALHVRPAAAEELDRAQELVVSSINDLTVRHGFGPIASARAPDFQAFCLRDDPHGAWLAEDDGEIAGFALSWVCGRLWFLAELFVAPGRQGQGIGDALMRRTLQHARDAGATEQALITFAFNLVSQGLYARHGLVPRVPILLCSAPRDALPLQPPHPALAASPIDRTAADLARLGRIDAASIGVARERHHAFLLQDPKVHGVFLDDGTETLGYAYVADSGHIGPLAVTLQEAMPGAVAAALAIASASAARQVSMFVPGTSPALALAAELGMRFTLPMVLLSSRGFGDWTRYLPRNPGFM